MYASVEETVVVDELMQILVECVKQADTEALQIRSLFHTDSAYSDDYFRSESEMMSSRELIVEEEEETSKKPERFKV
ncbi:hypothetical protein SASPL_108624 [Salvia splendens]|uniref:Uncharacterized protein n=1 Tax=Salvia splendens TaxID=180675 RepID=A0A8X8YFM4_SALSN|nr:hypothetical protein SASPL_108624 [Salvia splendens]